MVKGHLNYQLATYDGKLTWHGWEPPFLDSDYGFALSRDDHAGMTTVSKDGLAFEFFSRETIERFQSPWWKTFRDAVKRASNDDPALLVNGRFAIVSGLVGLDCVHGCDAEIHPALAVAIRVEESGDAERWAVFAAGSGNEGFCSKGRYSMTTPDQRFVVRLPWKTGMQLAEMNYQFFGTHPQAVTPQPAAVQGEGVSLVFDLKWMAGQNTMDGEIWMKWSSGVAATGTPRSGFTKASLTIGPEQERTVAPGPPPTPPSDDELLRGSSEEFSRLLLKLSPEVRRSFIAELKKRLAELPPPPYTKNQDHELKSEPVRYLSAKEFTQLFRPKGPPSFTVVEDPEKRAYDEVLRILLKEFAKELKAADLSMDSRGSLKE
jgi:hypothetical protein